MPQTTYIPQPQTPSPVSNGTNNAITGSPGGLTVNLVGCMYTQTSATATSGTSASSWLGTGIGTLTFPANYLVPGKTIRIRAGGIFTTAATPGTVSLAFGLGATTINQTAVTPTPSLTVSFEFELILTVRTVGSSGTMGYYGKLVYPSGSAPAAADYLFGQICSSTNIDTTASNTITLSTTNSVAAGAVFTIEALTVEVLN
jgi:hypothetical protein